MILTRNVAMAFVGLVLIGSCLGLWYDWMAGPGFVYQREIGAHVENAHEVNTPDEMRRELEMAVAGMRNLGLTPDRYGAWFFFEKTPHASMDFQYRFIDNLIERIDAVAADRQRQVASGTSDQYGDVFEEKMDNLRAFMDENGRTDWIAIAAWKTQFWYHYWGEALFLIFLVLGSILIIGAAAPL